MHKHFVYFEFSMQGNVEPTGEQRKDVADYIKEKIGDEFAVLYHANKTFSVRGTVSSEKEKLPTAKYTNAVSGIRKHVESAGDLHFSTIKNLKVTSSPELREKKGGRSRRRSHRSRRRTSRR